MKKIVLAFFIIIYPISASFSQDIENDFSEGNFGILAHTSSLYTFIDGAGTSLSSLSSPWVGFIYHCSSNFALKPAFMIKKTEDEEKSSGYKSNTETLLYGIELGVNYYFDPMNNLSIYIGPILQYSKYTREQTGSGSISALNIGSKDKSETNTFGAILCLGAQYMPSSQFGFFADIGIGYSKSEKKGTEDIILITIAGNEDEDTTTSFVTRGGNIGVVFYFN